MININEVKTGMSLKIDGNLFTVIEFQHVKPGKGPAFVRMKIKNMRTGAVIDNTFNSNIKLEPAHISKKEMQFLYNSASSYFFMNNDDFDQIEIDQDILKDKVNYLKEGLNINVVMYEGEIIDISLADKVSLKVIETETAVKGNTASSAMKDATLESGYVTKVPLFIEVGEEIIINTNDGKYSSRA